jgi:hypothetical protein
MATLAGNLERVLVKPADRHRASPGAGSQPKRLHPAESSR